MRLDGFGLFVDDMPTKLLKNLLWFVSSLIHGPEFFLEFCCKTDR